MGFVDQHLGELLGNARISGSTPDFSEERDVVSAITKGLTCDGAVGLVGFAHGHDNDSSRDRVAAAGEGHMSDWPEQSGVLGQRLAAAALIDLMESTNAAPAVAAALATEAATISGMAPAVLELAARAPAALGRLADARRAVSISQPSVQPFPPQKSVELPPDDASAVTSAYLRGHLLAGRNAIRAASANVEMRLRALERMVERSSEEVDLLWWTLTPFSDHIADWPSGREAVTLVAGLEVGRRTLLEPPPRGTAQLIREGLRKAAVDPHEQASLHDVVAELPDSALTDGQLGGRIDGWATPVLSAIRARLDGEEPEATKQTTAERARWALQVTYDTSLRRLLESEREASQT